MLNFIIQKVIKYGQQNIRGSSIKYLVNLFDCTEAAKVFYKLNPNKYVYKNDIWYILQENNIWKKMIKE